MHNLRATPTTDLEKAKRDLEESGYCIVENVAPVHLIQSAKIRRLEQAEAERGTNEAFLQDGNTQWIANVLNKGDVFLDLLTCSLIPQVLCEHLLGPNFILSCANAPIAGPGTRRMRMHSDQYWTPNIEKSPHEFVRLGSQDINGSMASKLPVKRDYLFPPCMVTLIWAITDFTEDNGATVFVPGSHLSGMQPDYHHDFEEAVPSEMSAGSIVLWDGRTWHSTGANRTTDEYRIAVTNNMVAPMIRPLVNYPYSLRPEVVDRLDEKQKQLLGFETWTAYGNEGVPTQRQKYFKPASEQLGPMA